MYYDKRESYPILDVFYYNSIKIVTFLIDWYRKEKKYKTTQIEEFHLPNVPSTEYSYFVKYEITSWLQSISPLPLERRNVLLLRDYYGFSYKEIAEMTGLSLAKVKIELHRGRKETKSIKE
ncbi:RNA polymerase sigma-70 factor ECF subfamily [Bacillus mycoides]|nr:RNA polymerase sigma-70 factor ECF subfamily [Bacillus mycoides]